MMRSSHFFKKTLSWLLFITFSSTQLCPNINLYAQSLPVKNLDHVGAVNLPIELKEVFLPPEFAIVKERFQGEEGNGFVVYIPDIHVNKLAQADVARIIKHLSKKYGLL